MNLVAFKQLLVQINFSLDVVVLGCRVVNYCYSLRSLVHLLRYHLLVFLKAVVPNVGEPADQMEHHLSEGYQQIVVEELVCSPLYHLEGSQQLLFVAVLLKRRLEEDRFDLEQLVALGYHVMEQVDQWKTVHLIRGLLDPVLTDVEQVPQKVFL